MPDHIIGPDDQGAYEITLQPGVATTVRIARASSFANHAIQVMAHSGSSPVYAGPGDITIADKKATIIPPSTWGDVKLPVNQDNTISIISAAAATVSVYRS